VPDVLRALGTAPSSPTAGDGDVISAQLEELRRDYQAAGLL